MDFATTSVLSQGQWFRVSVTQPGIHRISGDFLASELGIDLGAINPRSLAIFGQSSSGKLPEPIEEEAPDDLTEMAIQVIGEEDGSFDGGDAILFYAEGPDQLRYESSQDRFFYEKNVYATKTTTT
jgi:hypothetical protein